MRASCSFLTALRHSWRNEQNLRVVATALHGSRAFTGSDRRLAGNGDWQAKETSTSGLPEVTTEVEEASRGAISEAELKSRQRQAVESWLETRLGRERLEVVKILQEHRIIVRGGSEEGRRFIDALLAWKQAETSV